MAETKNVVILGSTGSIGTQALDIIREHRDSFNVVALSANRNATLLAEQVNEFKPDFGLLCDESYRSEFESAVSTKNETEFLYGNKHLVDLVQSDKADVILNALVGFAGFDSTIKALETGKRVALANKESLVVGGKLIMDTVKKHSAELIPVDSEHSAMFQCIVGEKIRNIEKIVITASGGPFRTKEISELKNVTVGEALNHPNWDMGAKITIDSSTMMNKGLEIIEAHWLFDMPVENIEPVIHPQSIIHSIVTFKDGSSKAQLGPPDMKVPIIYALSYPERMDLYSSRIDWSETQQWSFEPVDYEKFPCVRLAMDSLSAGGVAPAVLNAANEIAVERFLKEEIDYIDIPEIVDRSMQQIRSNDSLTIDHLKEIDEETRKFAATL